MRVLGIDPGTWVMGFGVVERRGSSLVCLEVGALNLGARSVPLATRLVRIHEAIRDLVTKHAPDCISLEEAFHGRSAQAALRIGEARGVALLTASLMDCVVHQYPPATVKKAVTGNGNADKSQVAFMVTRLLGLHTVPEPLDASDALAIAICHCHRQEFTPHGT